MRNTCELSNRIPKVVEPYVHSTYTSLWMYEDVSMEMLAYCVAKDVFVDFERDFYLSHLEVCLHYFEWFGGWSERNIAWEA